MPGDTVENDETVLAANTATNAIRIVLVEKLMFEDGLRGS